MRHPYRVARLDSIIRFRKVGGMRVIDPMSLVGIAGAPLVIALVQLVRVTEPDLPGRYLPALTLLLAMLLNLFLATLVGTPIPLALLVGLVTGLTASGLYSQATAGLVAPPATTLEIAAARLERRPMGNEATAGSRPPTSENGDGGAR